MSDYNYFCPRCNKIYTDEDVEGKERRIANTDCFGCGDSTIAFARYCFCGKFISFAYPDDPYCSDGLVCEDCIKKQIEETAPWKKELEEEVLNNDLWNINIKVLLEHNKGGDPVPFFVELIDYRGWSRCDIRGDGRGYGFEGFKTMEEMKQIVETKINEDRYSTDVVGWEGIDDEVWQRVKLRQAKADEINIKYGKDVV